MRKNQAGFSLVETVILLIVIVVVAAAGYEIYHRDHKSAVAKQAAGTTAQSVKATNVSSAPAVNNTSDLTKAEQVLDQNDPSSANNSDLSQFNSQASGF